MRSRPALRVALAVAITIGCRGAQGEPARPSIVIAVLDTTRADAVSAYGDVTGTTPTVDRLAAEGIRYTRAYAHGSWTLPSHASLFTGLPPPAHGVSWRRLWADDGLVMLAERLRDDGYETVAVSENPWITPHFNMTQGFDRISYTKDAARGVREWIEQRGDGPYFLFVNIFDAHHPYEVRERNRFVPKTTTTMSSTINNCQRLIPPNPIISLHHSTQPHRNTGQISNIRL